ncbi:3,4-dihydroxy 2-butanone 4-phosphate synthase / GTP cyclohydrolase II [Kytococcus aerolatus]|uniref:Multifunctional fusion protein n=1 Tax=Kytococcus aerolatus TaxID=592308 RepID=A0A212TF36_9MICO|nr:3,4-dihydroxy-2-butanone-4-phosphate synthase [Kytococcus aerolatus]SNC64657.1 3,4-dihydroxy 2-butanone 4-phosphate synthase / GTP cyclohydrolase II [Kytococcus aerolatus]
MSAQPAPQPGAARDYPALAAALEALRAGRPVLVLDDEDRENEGDVILAAEVLTPEWMAWTIRHTSGYVCAPMPAERAEALALPLMVRDNADPFRTAYTITVDAAQGVTTGISAADRTHTLRTLADPAATPEALVRPGHVVPLRARAGGVLERPGHTEAAVDLCRLAGLEPVGVIAELVHDDGTMMRADGVRALAAEHDLPVLTIEALRAWRTVHDRLDAVAAARLPTLHGEFTAHACLDRLSGVEHLALVAPGVDPAGVVPVRVHSECLTGDALGSLRCDCGAQLEDALADAQARAGVVLYVRGHEGRGIGLAAKIAAYARQDAGADTVDANTELGLPVDSREYAVAAAMLAHLGVERVELTTNNPAKVDALRALGVDVAATRPSVVGVTEHNLGYLTTKRDRMGHTLPARLDVSHATSAAPRSELSERPGTRDGGSKPSHPAIDPHPTTDTTDPAGAAERSRPHGGDA